jgi:hypothetical protein
VDHTSGETCHRPAQLQQRYVWTQAVAELSV